MLKVIVSIYSDNKTKINEILNEHQQSRNLDIYNKKENISISAYKNDQYAGGLVAKQTDDSIHIERLGILKEYRYLGLGSKLLSHLIIIAQKNNCTVITLTTLNHQAKDFYLKHNFKLLGEIKNVPKRGHIKYYMYYELTY